MPAIPNYSRLAAAHEEKGKWSKVVASKLTTYDDIEYLLKGSNYFKHGIKPRFTQMSSDILNGFGASQSHIEADPVTALRKLYGVSVSKAYDYCPKLGLSLPIKHVESDLGRSESRYETSGLNSDSDCCVRAFAGMLDVSYDSALKLVSHSAAHNVAEQGLDDIRLAVACKDNNLAFFHKERLFAGRNLTNTTTYELFTMVPELEKERMCILVYRHIFYIDCGVVFDLENYLHSGILGIVCEISRARHINDKIAQSLSISPLIQDVAYERWANGTSWDNIAFDLRMKTNEIRLMAETHECALEIEDLMYNWRSKDEFIHWISTYDNILSRVSRRLGIEEDVCEKIIKNVKFRHGIKYLDIR